MFNSQPVWTSWWSLLISDRQRCCGTPGDHLRIFGLGQPDGAAITGSVDLNLWKASIIQSDQNETMEVDHSIINTLLPCFTNTSQNYPAQPLIYWIM